MKNIEQELKSQNKREILKRIKESKLAISFLFLFIAAGSWGIYKKFDTVIESNKVSGVLVGLHQTHNSLWNTTTMLSIKLKNGSHVLVTAPDNFIVRNKANVEIIKNKTKQGSVSYGFSRYMESK